MATLPLTGNNINSRNRTEVTDSRKVTWPTDRLQDNTLRRRNRCRAGTVEVRMGRRKCMSLRNIRSRRPRRRPIINQRRVKLSWKENLYQDRSINHFRKHSIPAATKVIRKAWLNVTVFLTLLILRQPQEISAVAVSADNVASVDSIFEKAWFQIIVECRAFVLPLNSHDRLTPNAKIAPCSRRVYSHFRRNTTLCTTALRTKV